MVQKVCKDYCRNQSIILWEEFKQCWFLVFLGLCQQKEMYTIMPALHIHLLTFMHLEKKALWARTYCSAFSTEKTVRCFSCNLICGYSQRCIMGILSLSLLLCQYVCMQSNRLERHTGMQCSKHTNHKLNEADLDICLTISRSYLKLNTTHMLVLTHLHTLSCTYSRPEATRLTIMEVEVDELWTSTVAKIPTTSPATGLDSTALSWKMSPATLPGQICRRDTKKHTSTKKKQSQS